MPSLVKGAALVKLGADYTRPEQLSWLSLSSETETEYDRFYV